FLALAAEARPVGAAHVLPARMTRRGDPDVIENFFLSHSSGIRRGPGKNAPGGSTEAGLGLNNYSAPTPSPRHSKATKPILEMLYQPAAQSVWKTEDKERSEV